MRGCSGQKTVVCPRLSINANPASDPDLIPTQLSIEGQPGIKVTYPAAQTFKAPFVPQGIAVYQGRFALRTHLPQTSAQRPPAASLRVQACNDQYCLAPSTVVVRIKGMRL